MPLEKGVKVTLEKGHWERGEFEKYKLSHTDIIIPSSVHLLSRV